jgi:hypothetical protein
VTRTAATGFDNENAGRVAAAGIALAILDQEMLRDRWLAVSATALTAYFRPVLGWLRGFCSVGNLGGTILLYRFHEPPDYDVRGPDRPAAPCDGDVSHRERPTR